MITRRMQFFLGAFPPVLTGLAEMRLNATGAMEADPPVDLVGIARMHLRAIGNLDGAETPLPCPPDPIDRLVVMGTRHSDGSRGPLVADRSNEKNEREVSFDFEVGETDRAAIMAAWAGGTGCVRRFAFTLPDETEKLWVFKDGSFSMQRINAVTSRTRFTLIDVTPEGYTP